MADKQPVALRDLSRTPYESLVLRRLCWIVAFGDLIFLLVSALYFVAERLFIAMILAPCALLIVAIGLLLVVFAGIYRKVA